MKTTHRLVPRTALMIAMAFAMAGCGVLAGPSESETVAEMIDVSLRIQNDLDNAVAVAAGSGLSTSPESRAIIARIEEAISDFAAAAADLDGETDLGSTANSYAQAANLVSGLLSDGTIGVAVEVKSTQVDTRFLTLREQLLVRQSELGGPDTEASWLVLAVIVAAIAAVLVLVARRRPVSLADKLASSGATPPPPSGAGPLNFESFDSPVGGVPLPPPIGSDESTLGITAVPQRIRNPEAIHSVRGGLRTVELDGIIDAALATIVDAGWEVAIECPRVHVLVDPLRMRRLLSNLLLSATSHAAEHIGLVAVIVGDKVEINIGHDGSLLRGVSDDVKTAPPEVEHQLTVARQMLGGMHADVRWTNWRGVSLYTIELVRGPDEQADRPDHLVAAGG